MTKTRGILMVLVMGSVGQVMAAGVEEPARVGISAAIEPAAVMRAMTMVADWQLAHPSAHPPTDWTQAAGYTGFMALARLPGGEKYERAMLAVGERTGWRLGPQCRFFADDQCVGQMYLDMYARHKVPEMMAETRRVMDDFVAKGDPADAPMKHVPENYRQRWTWCDALYMAPAVLAKLRALTGEAKYEEALVREYKRTTAHLLDKDEWLYFRDDSYFAKRETNGRKVFWGRGNGWVFAGLANILRSLPADAAARPYFEGIYKPMAARVIALQQPDGLWRASLLDPASYPLQEISGSGFFCYGLAWGINNGLLDRASHEPAVRKAWAAMVGCVEPDGKLTHVQPIGADPKQFDTAATEIYGVGAFLLAGSEIHKLAR